MNMILVALRQQTSRETQRKSLISSYFSIRNIETKISPSTLQLYCCRSQTIANTRRSISKVRMLSKCICESESRNNSPTRNSTARQLQENAGIGQMELQEY